MLKSPTLPVKNPNWKVANQLVIYKAWWICPWDHGGQIHSVIRGFEPGSSSFKSPTLTTKPCCLPKAPIEVLSLPQLYQLLQTFLKVYRRLRRLFGKPFWKIEMLSVIQGFAIYWGNKADCVLKVYLKFINYENLSNCIFDAFEVIKTNLTILWKPSYSSGPGCSKPD